MSVLSTRMDANSSDCGYSAHPRCMWSPRHSWSNTSTNLGRFRYRIEEKYHVTFGEYYCDLCFASCSWLSNIHLCAFCLWKCVNCQVHRDQSQTNDLISARNHISHDHISTCQTISATKNMYIGHRSYRPNPYLRQVRNKNYYLCRSSSLCLDLKW